VKRKWKHSFLTLFLGLSLSVSLTGCFAHPAPRPEMADPASAHVHGQVAATAARVPGAGQTAAVVLGDVALVAIQLNAEVPGGTHGGRIGEPHVLDGRGAGGGVTATPAMPGGGISPSGGAAGGTPNSTQAIRNGSSGPALLTGSTVPPAPATSSSGTTPIDVMNRVADQIRTEHRYIREVRVLNMPADTVRLGRISRELAGGRSISEFRPDLDALFHSGINLGTTHTPPFHPAQGTDTPTKRR